jgi:hypothetical protein
MSLVATFLLAAAVASTPAEPSREADRGAQIESARISVVILRPAVLKGGVLASNEDPSSPRSQRRSASGSVTYIFE